MDLLVKGTAHARMKVIGGKTTVKASATTDIGCLTKSLKKMKMNNLTFRQFFVIQIITIYAVEEKCLQKVFSEIVEGCRDGSAKSHRNLVKG